MILSSNVSSIADQLIPAKISLPHHQVGIIPRTQLSSMLEGVFTHRLTLVSAPAGYGKTTLVSDWVANQSSPVAWLSLTKDDNQIPVFLSYLSAALKKANPSFGNCIEEVLHQEQVIDLPSFMVSLLQEIDQITPAMLLVLDDYHLIQNPQIHALIQFLLQNSSNWTEPENSSRQGCHLILISRTDPPFPLSKWRIHQELIEIGIDELKFSLAETEEFLKKANKPEIQPDRIQKIVTLTEGWVTGLQLSLLGMKSSVHPHSDNPEIHAKNQLIVDYLMEEVIQDLPEDVRTFLMQTSILEHMTADLCDHIRGKHDSQQILEWLVRENLFIIPMDDKKGWYRYHQLFLDVLVQRRYLIEKDKLQKAHHKAAQWLEEKGYIQESLLQWLAAENLSQAARMVAKNAPRLLFTSQYLMLRELLDHFSENTLLRYPWLCIYRAWSYSVIVDYSLTHWLGQAMEAIQSEQCKREYSEEEIREMQGNIYTIWALHKARHGDDEETITYAEKALSLLPADGRNVRGMALIALAKIHYRKGDLDQALNILFEARRMLQDEGNISGTTEALYLTGRISRIKGKLKAAYQYYQEAVSIPTSQPWHEMFFGYLSYSGMGMIALEWNQLERAKSLFEKGFSKQSIQSVIDKVSNHIASLEANLWIFDPVEAGKIAKELETYLENQLVPRFQKNNLIAVLLKFYALNHDFLIARQFITEHKVDLIRPGDFIRESQLISLAYFYWMTADFDQIEILMQQFLPALEKGGRYDRLIQMETLYAVAFFQAGDSQNAFRHFSTAVNLGMKDDYLGTYVSFGEPVIRLIDAFTESEMALEAEPTVLSKFQEISKVILQRINKTPNQDLSTRTGESINRYPQGNLNVVLTPQEDLILKYLASQNDQKTIAKELNLSIYTVKTHIYHVYDKLDVHNRMEAVIKAKKLGLI